MITQKTSIFSLINAADIQTHYLKQQNAIFVHRLIIKFINSQTLPSYLGILFLFLFLLVILSHTTAITTTKKKPIARKETRNQ